MRLTVLLVVAMLAVAPGVAAADWSAPERVGDVEHANAMLVGSDGRALLIGGDDLHLRSPGGAFTARPLSDPDARSGHFALAGDVLVGSWESTAIVAPRLMGSVGTLESPIAPVALSSRVGRVISLARPVAASPNGHAVVTENLANGLDCFYVRVPTGEWSSCLRAENGYFAEAVAINDRGDVAVLLERLHDEMMALAFRPAGGAFGAPVAVAVKHATVGSFSSGIALDGAGNTLAAFDADGGVVVSRRVGDGAVVSEVVAPGGIATDLVADESGRALLTWAQPDGSSHAIKARTGTVAGGLDGGVADAGRAPGPLVRTTGAVAPSGRAVVAWTGGDPRAPSFAADPAFTVGAAALPSGDKVTLTTCAPSNVLAAGISDDGEGLVAYHSSVMVDELGARSEVSRVHVAVHDRRGGRVGRPAPGCGKGDAARVTRLRVRPAKLEPGERLRITYRLSARSKVRFSFERKRRGRYRKVAGSLTRQGGAGTRTFRLRRSLEPGRYRLVARPQGGRAARRSFTVAGG